MSIICKYFNKKYKTMSSRSNHYRIYHKDVVKANVKVVKNNVKANVKAVKGDNTIITDNETLLHICNFCNKILKSRQSKWEHQTKYCKKNKEINNNTNDIIINELKKENAEIKSMLNDIIKQFKIHPKT